MIWIIAGGWVLSALLAFPLAIYWARRDLDIRRRDLGFYIAWSLFGGPISLLIATGGAITAWLGQQLPDDKWGEVIWPRRK